MRTRPIVAASALIAAAALVAIAGPAASQAPGSDAGVGADAFTRIAPPLVVAPISASPAPERRLEPPAAAQVIVDPGLPAQPSARAAAGQPNAPVGVVVKPTPTPRPATVSRGGSWQRAAYSWYGSAFYGNGTACGQTFSSTILGTAHRTLPCGTKVTFRNPKNGRQITVPVIDRGPYAAGRLWDLSAATCSYLGNCYTGIIEYRLP